MILQHTATTIMQHQFKESTLLPLSFSNAITSLLDSPRKRYFHDFSLEKTLPSFYCRDTSEIASGIAISKVRRVPIVPSWRSSSVGWTGSRREIRSRVAFASIRLLSRWILPSGGGRIPPISWNVARYRWKVSRSHFANAISWFCREIRTTFRVQVNWKDKLSLGIEIFEFVLKVRVLSLKRI